MGGLVDYRGVKKVAGDGGRTFDSKAERSLAEYFNKVRDDLEIEAYQDQIYLTDSRILYKPDFRVRDENNVVFWAEMKGFETPVWRIKRRLWKCYGPGRLDVYKPGKYGPRFYESIFSKKISEPGAE